MSTGGAPPPAGFRRFSTGAGAIGRGAIRAPKNANRLANISIEARAGNEPRAAEDARLPGTFRASDSRLKQRGPRARERASVRPQQGHANTDRTI
jgi:hypothetical protein